MRTLELLQGFSTKELKEIEVIVDHKKRKSLPKLFNALKPYIKKEKTPPYAELYPKVFGKRYDDSKASAIHHELRLLNEILYEQLAIAQFRESIKNDQGLQKLWLGKAFLKRQLWDILFKDIDAYIAVNQEGIKPNRTVELHKIRLTSYISKADKNEKNLLKMVEMIAEMEKEVHRGAKYSVRDLEEIKVYVEYLLQYQRETVDEVNEQLLKDVPV